MTGIGKKKYGTGAGKRSAGCEAEAAASSAHSSPEVDEVTQNEMWEVPGGRQEPG